MTRKKDKRPTLPAGLVVSCQAETGSPFDSPPFIAAFACAAEMGGAVAVRIRDVENVRAVRAVVSIPIIGITKSSFADGDVLITPNTEDVADLVAAGADIVALDATARRRPNGLDGPASIGAITKILDIPLLADVATVEEGVAAMDAGAVAVATTLSGHTRATRVATEASPDLRSVAELAERFPGSVIAEGRYWTPSQVSQAFVAGARAVCVGTAITRPVDIVRRFVEEIRATSSRST